MQRQMSFRHTTAMETFRQACHTPLVSLHRHQHEFSQMPTDYVISVHQGHCMVSNSFWVSLQCGSHPDHTSGLTLNETMFYDKWMLLHGHTGCSQTKIITHKNINMLSLVLCMYFVLNSKFKGESSYAKTFKSWTSSFPKKYLDKLP